MYALDQGIHANDQLHSGRYLQQGRIVPDAGYYITAIG
jgi:hypothetical protein